MQQNIEFERCIVFWGMGKERGGVPPSGGREREKGREKGEEPGFRN